MLLIMCPKSKSGKGKKLWPDLLDRLRLADFVFEQAETKYAGHATEIAAKADETVVAVGGDGMINEVLNGVMQRDGKQAMGVLYTGTSPDFCKFHGIPVGVGQAVEALLSGGRRKIDLVEIEFKNKSSELTKGHFGCSCNIGLGSDVADFANKNRKYFGDTLGTFLGLVKALITNKPFDLELIVDGKSHELRSCSHLMIIKNPYIASGIKVGVDINAADGKGYVLAILAKGKYELLKILPGFYKGDPDLLQKLVASGKLWMSEFTNLDVRGPDDVKVEYDGDSKGYLPLKAKVIHEAIDLLGAKNAGKNDN